MEDRAIGAALDRAEQALGRIEAALSRRQAVSGRDEQLRAKVRAAVTELDELIRQAS